MSDEECQSCKETPEMKLADALARIEELEDELSMSKNDAYDEGYAEGYSVGYSDGTDREDDD